MAGRLRPGDDTPPALTVRTADQTIAARTGDLVYLPAGSPGSLHADEDEDVELVRVTYPPDDE